MPRPIQTLNFADALARLFRLYGKAKLESDEVVVPTVGVDLNDVPYCADGCHYFNGAIAAVGGGAVKSHCFLINPVAGDGVLVCDHIHAHTLDQILWIGWSHGVTSAGSRVFSAMQPWRQDVAAVRQLPPLVRNISAGGPFGADFYNWYPTANPNVGAGSDFHVDGPFVMPGRVDREELVVRSASDDQALVVNFKGRWYPGLKATELL